MNSFSQSPFSSEQMAATAVPTHSAAMNADSQRVSRRAWGARLGGSLGAWALAGLISREMQGQDLEKTKQAPLSPLGEGIQFGLVTYMWGADWDVPTLIANCESANVSGVELRVDHAHGVQPGLTPAEREEVRRRFEDSKVVLVGLGTNFAFHAADAAEVRQNLKEAKAYVKLSHDVGGSGVKVKPDQLPKGVPVDQTLEQIGRSLADLADYGVGFGQEIRLEVHGAVTKLAHIKKIMEIADHPGVRVCWNSNDQDLEDGGIESNFAMVQDYLGRTVHIREVNEGVYPYARLAELLVKADYEGWVCLEARTKPGDRVAALAEQRRLFMDMVEQARRALD